MTDTKDEAALKITGAMALMLSVFLLPLYYGWAAWLMWGWFALPFMGTVSWGQAVGIVMLAGVFRMRTATKEEQQRSLAETLSAIMTQVLAVALAVGVGWLAHVVGLGTP